MEKGLIITLPCHDDTTEYLSQWSAEIVKKADSKSVKVKKLEGSAADKDDFKKIIKGLDYKMLVLNGHGSSKAIYGHNDKPLIEQGDNESLLINRIVYARSCDSAASLGKSCTDSGKGCFIGYNAPFMFYVDSNWTSNPKKDPVAAIFLSSSNKIPMSILKGNSCQTAYENGRKAIIKSIKKILRNKTPDSYRIAEALLNNYHGQTILGDGNNSLRS